MDARTRQFVRKRAGHRCEYCHLREASVADISFHVEHIRALKHGGTDDPANLALSCDRCNLHKGPNLAGIDPADGQMTPLFNPRFEQWDEHFEWANLEIAGKTPIGRAKVRVLELNSARRLKLRRWVSANQIG